MPEKVKRLESELSKFVFKGRNPVVLFITEIKSKSVQTQLNLVVFGRILI
jgi:hypothetical protein